MGNNQGKYQGDMKNGKRDGWGICAFKDRSYYEGEWVADQMDGKGIYVKPDGSRYEGYWQANLQNGFGRLSLPNGDVYEGEFRDGKMDGYGTYFYKNGSIYDGEFIEDEAHGLGTFKGSNGEFYQGEWQVDKMHGVGVYKFVGGAKYRGEWKFGKLDGYGIYENLEKDAFVGKFEGQFLDGKMDGLGLYYWSEGDMYMGEYAQDKRHGIGIYTSIKGAVYKGEYYNGERSGWGEYTNSKGDVYEGQWKRNVRNGKGVVTLSEADQDMVRVLGEDAGEDQRRWAQVWFKDSPARPRDIDGSELEIDPTRTFAGTWVKGKAKQRRPYRFEDWTKIQMYSTNAADNAAVAVEESQQCVILARKAASFAEETARTTVAKMQAEAEHKDAYFVHVQKGVDKRGLEDRHMVRFGPEVTRDTLLVVCGPDKAAEMRANSLEITWMTPVASAMRDAALEKDKLMSPSVVAWIKKTETRMRRDVNWHVVKPEQSAGGRAEKGRGYVEADGEKAQRMPETTFSKRGGRQEADLRDFDLANASNARLRQAMKDFRDAGVPGALQQKPTHPGRIPPPPPRPKDQQKQLVTPRKFIVDPRDKAGRPPLPPVMEGSFQAGSDFDGFKAGEDGFKSVAPSPSISSTRSPSTATSVWSSASSASRYSRHNIAAPVWAGGAPMPPPKGILQKMQKAQRADEKAGFRVKTRPMPTTPPKGFIDKLEKETIESAKAQKAFNESKRAFVFDVEEK